MELRGEKSFDGGDRAYWELIAKRRKLRLPLWRMPCTTGGFRRWLRKLGIEVEEYLEANNDKRLNEFIVMNPDIPLRAWVGQQLEWSDEREGYVLENYDKRK